MAAKGKRTKGKINNYTKGVTPITPVNPPWWGPTWGGNRANVPVPPPNYALFDLSNVQKPVWMQPGYGSIAANTFPAFQPSTSTTPTTQTTTKTVDNTNPEMRYFNPYLQTAPANQADNLPADYTPQWNPWRDPVFAWREDMSGLSGQFREGINPTDFDYYDRNFVWDEEKYGPKEEWSSSYHPLYYQNQTPSSLQWLAGSSNGGTMGSRGWRRPGRYYIPEQQVTRLGPNGPITAERPPNPKRRGEEEESKGNNRNVSIPAWVGSLVSWRT